MKTLIIALAVVFVQLLLAEGTHIRTKARNSDNVAGATRHTRTADFPLCNTLPEPLKLKYVIREGEAFVIAVQADCPSGSPNDAKFEFVETPPRFVNFSFPYRGPRSALALLLVDTRAGDAGDYRITFDVTHCTGGVGCGRQSFRLKVKRAL